MNQIGQCQKQGDSLSVIIPSNQREYLRLRGAELDTNDTDTIVRAVLAEELTTPDNLAQHLHRNKPNGKRMHITLNPIQAHKIKTIAARNVTTAQSIIHAALYSATIKTG